MSDANDSSRPPRPDSLSVMSADNAAVESTTATRRPEASEPGRPVVERAGQTTSGRRGAVALGAGRWMLYLGVSALFLRPILITAIVADDFLNPFDQVARVGLSPWATFDYAVEAVSGSGHFNYLGQTIGAFYTAVTMWLASEFGIRFSTMYALTKFVTFIGVATAAGVLLCEIGRYLGATISPWRSRILVSAILFSTLQLHNFWSNDPVGSYPLSGFASAMIGLFALAVAINAVRVDSRWMPTVAGLALTAALLYYEINVALIPAVAVFALIDVLKTAREARWRLVKHLAPTVVIPTVLAVVLQRRSSAASANYDGTSLELNADLLSTFGKSVVSSLPGSAWDLSREFLSSTVALRPAALVTLTIVVSVVATLVVVTRPTIDWAPAAPPMWKTGSVAATLIAFWLGATFIQASTSKVQDEVRRIGQVYNYYAIGSTVVALLLALAIHLYAHRIPHLVRPSLLVGLAAFVTTQFMITWNLSERFNAATIPNQNLLIAYTEHWSMSERCDALVIWSSGAWPDYYELGMIEGLDAGYRRFQSEPFCDGFVRPP